MLDHQGTITFRGVADDGAHTPWSTQRPGCARCEPTERRMLNRALFTKIVLDEDESITFVPGGPQPPSSSTPAATRRPIRARTRDCPVIGRGSLESLKRVWS